jgi:hypothetical protein
MADGITIAPRKLEFNRMEIRGTKVVVRVDA